jgi:hypothetical protein
MPSTKQTQTLDIPDQRRDALVLKLLKTPPQPRPKRERGTKKAKRKKPA